MGNTLFDFISRYISLSEDEKCAILSLAIFRTVKKGSILLKAAQRSNEAYFVLKGIPYGKSHEAPQEKFPGYIREYGFALVYQHFWWKGLYTGVYVMNAWQSFVNEEENKIGKGFQVFNTYRAGYHFKFFKDRFFIQPSVAVTHRPFHTEMPEAFKNLDDKWSKFFIGEPGLHFGFDF